MFTGFKCLKVFIENRKASKYIEWFELHIFEMFLSQIQTPMFKPNRRIDDFDTDFVDDYLDEINE